jgi:predicted XRE-type DNA-binding protein
MKEQIRRKIRKPRTKPEKAELSSGNIYADLGFQDAEERLLKTKLASQVAQLIEKKSWTQSQAAERTGLDQPKDPD